MHCLYWPFVMASRRIHFQHDHVETLTGKTWLQPKTWHLLQKILKKYSFVFSSPQPWIEQRFACILPVDTSFYSREYYSAFSLLVALLSYTLNSVAFLFVLQHMIMNCGMRQKPRCCTRIVLQYSVRAWSSAKRRWRADEKSEGNQLNRTSPVLTIEMWSSSGGCRVAPLVF